MKTYLWIACHDEGLQHYGSLQGDGIIDALANQLRKDGTATIYCLDDFTEQLGELTEEMLTKKGRNATPQEVFTRIAKHVADGIKDSVVDGDSGYEIKVIDITDPLEPVTLWAEEFK